MITTHIRWGLTLIPNKGEVDRCVPPSLGRYKLYKAGDHVRPEEWGVCAAARRFYTRNFHLTPVLERPLVNVRADDPILLLYWKTALEKATVLARLHSMSIFGWYSGTLMSPFTQKLTKIYVKLLKMKNDVDFNDVQSMVKKFKIKTGTVYYYEDVFKLFAAYSNSGDLTREERDDVAELIIKKSVFYWMFSAQVNDRCVRRQLKHTEQAFKLHNLVVPSSQSSDSSSSSAMEMKPLVGDQLDAARKDERFESMHRPWENPFFPVFKQKLAALPLPRTGDSIKDYFPRTPDSRVSAASIMSVADVSVADANVSRIRAEREQRRVDGDVSFHEFVVKAKDIVGDIEVEDCRNYWEIDTNELRSVEEVSELLLSMFP